MKWHSSPGVQCYQALVQCYSVPTKCLDNLNEDVLEMPCVYYAGSSFKITQGCSWLTPGGNPRGSSMGAHGKPAVGGEQMQTAQSHPQMELVA